MISVSIYAPCTIALLPYRSRFFDDSLYQFVSHSRLSVGRPLRASGKVRANIPYKHAFHVTKILTLSPYLLRACKESRTGRGPITIRTPNGLGVEEWAAGLEKYAKMYQNLDGVDNYDIKK